MTSPTIDSSTTRKESERKALGALFAIIALLSLLDWAAVATPIAKDWRDLLPDNTSTAPTLLAVETSTNGGKPTPCPEVDGKFECAKNSWAYVGTRRGMNVSGTQQTCTWAHPLAKKALIIKHSPLALDDGEVLLLETALDDRAVSGRGGAVDVNVVVGEKKIARHTHRDKRGWQTLEITGPRDGALTLEVSAKNTGRRHFCYRLRAK